MIFFLIYSVVDVYIEELEDVVHADISEELAEKVVANVNKNWKELLKKDLDYLHKMKQMDIEFRDMKRNQTLAAQEITMSDVVPMAGLVMARFHMYEVSEVIFMVC